MGREGVAKTATTSKHGHVARGSRNLSGSSGMSWLTLEQQMSPWKVSAEETQLGSYQRTSAKVLRIAHLRSCCSTRPHYFISMPLDHQSLSTLVFAAMQVLMSAQSM